MIDNIILLINGHLHQRSIQELLPKCHPLGIFEQMGAITVADIASLYNAILIDTPYFIDCISEHDLDELNVEIIRNTLYKVLFLFTVSMLCSSVIKNGEFLCDNFLFYC
jgi:V-type H+-transporting ATPase subunit d